MMKGRERHTGKHLLSFLSFPNKMSKNALIMNKKGSNKCAHLFECA